MSLPGQDYLPLPCHGGPLWAQLGLWVVKSERLFSPKATLRFVSREAEFGTQQTPVFSN
jgi:hypothetical protein